MTGPRYNRAVDQTKVALYAEEMLRLNDAAALAEPISACDSELSLEGAYAIALEALRRRERSGWRRVGRKLGFTNRTIYEQYGVYAPIFGYMYDRTVTEAAQPGEGAKAELSLQGLVQPLIEPEIAFGLRQVPPRTRHPVELLGCIEWMAHGFEIVQCHFPGWKFTAPDTVADGGLHGRYVLGPRIPIAGPDKAELARQLATFEVVLHKDGEPVARGGGDLVLASPLNAVAHLVEVLAALPDHPPLQPGEIVTTGTLTAALPVEAGQTWSTRFEGVGVAPLELRFV